MTRLPIKGPRIGAHKSIAKSIDLAIDRAVASTCECLQLFTRPPRRWNSAKKSLSKDVVEKFITKSQKSGYFDTVIHMPYLPNLASSDDELFHRSINVLQEEIAKAELLKISFVVTHLGSPKEKDNDFASKRVVRALNEVTEDKTSPVLILLENSTAKRRTWGNKIEHIEAIIKQVSKPERLGVCFDTAHAFASGYDIRQPEILHEVFDHFDSISRNIVKVVHINDSQGVLNSGIDHHEHIGQGHIGLPCFRELMQHPRFKEIPMILETPKSNDYGDKENLDLLRKLRNASL
ncbi:MAG: deoxyribonuclease IV [Candidatus Hodarchaeales archaeon]